jgi:hypothetical protein
MHICVILYIYSAGSMYLYHASHKFHSYGCVLDVFNYETNYLHTIPDFQFLVRLLSA